MPEWLLEVLAGGRLRQGERNLPLERKTAALLAYLALEGASPRSKLAGLLWPDSAEETARGNLRQLLKRLRETTGASLVSAGDPLSLVVELHCDAARLQVAAFLGNHAEVAAYEGELLAGYDYDDCPDLDDWLLSRRDRLAGLRRDALSSEVRRLEAEGDYAEALACADRLLDTDPISETSHRLIMRLNYLLGDRPAAFRAYARCKEVLKRELGVDPLPETVALAREIERGFVTPPQSQTVSRPTIPISVLRPPLAGRARAWAALEAAWETGKPIFISGEAGVGKSRLMCDFVASKGPFVLFESRPGDGDIPFSSQARHLRTLLAARPETPLEPWVRQELSRLLPELSSNALPPISSQTDKLRLFEALAALLQSHAEGLVALLNDDLHYTDAASFEAKLYLFDRLDSDGRGSPLRAVQSFRRGELNPEIDGKLRELALAGRVVLIELEPLTPQGVTELLAGLELTEAERLGESLTRYTGGNPLFIVETLKSLIESGGMARGLTRHAPPPGRVRTLLSRRLDRLSPAASRLLQVAAVAEEAFDLELAGAVLGMAPLELSGAVLELETAQMMQELRFCHDLLFETVLETTPAPVKVLLHRRVLDLLTERGAAAARLARHAEAGGLTEASFRHHLQAGDDAMRLFALHSAIAHYERAHHLSLHAADFEPLKKVAVSELRRLYYQLGFAYIYTNAFAKARALYEALLAFAQQAGRPELEWLAQSHLAYLAVHDGYDLARADAYGQAALATARRTAAPKLLIEAHQELAGLYTLAHQPDAALPHAEEALAVARELGDPELVGRSLFELELAHWKLGRWQGALAALEEAREVYRGLGNPALEARALHSLGFDRIALGQAPAGLEAAHEALSLSRRAESRQEGVNAAGVAALAYLELGRYGEAQGHAHEAVEAARGLNVPVLLVMSLRRLALAQLACLDLEKADLTLREASTLNEALPRRPRIGELEVLLCQLRLFQDRQSDALRHAHAMLAATDVLLAEPWSPRWPVVECLVRAQEFDPAGALLARYRQLAHGSPRHRLTLLQAQAALERGQGLAEQAARSLEEALKLALTLSLKGAEGELCRQLAGLERQLGRLEQAEHHEARAAGIAEELAATLRDPAERETFLAAALRAHAWTNLTEPNALAARPAGHRIPS